MTPFDDVFRAPLCLGDREGFAVSAERYSREAAAEEISMALDRPVDPAELAEDRARYQFPPEGMEGENGWWLGASGKGSKPVWVLWLI